MYSKYNEILMQYVYTNLTNNILENGIGNG